MSDLLTREQIAMCREQVKRTPYVRCLPIDKLCDMALLALKDEPEGWVSVKERLPESQRNVLAYYKNALGNGRRIRAFYAPKHTVEDGGEFQGDADYVEDTDTYYYPEGWYEFNEHEEVNWRVDETVTHWMPLPAPPKPSRG